MQGIPHLKKDNWAEWNSLVLDLVDTCPSALKILIGEIEEGEEGYNNDIDKELFIFLQMILPSEMRRVIREVKRKVGLKGSAAYQALIERVVKPYREYISVAILAGQGKRTLQGYYDRMQFLFWDAEDTGIVYTAEEQLTYFLRGLSDPKYRSRLTDLLCTDCDIDNMTMEDVFRLLSEKA